MTKSGSPGRRGGYVAASLALAAAVASSAPAATASRTHTIAIANLAFGPAPSGLRVGDTIVWVNQDIFQHTATARDGSFDLDMAPKARARVRLKRAGVVNVYCRYHPGMTEKLTVAR